MTGPRWQGARRRLRRSLHWRIVGLFALLALATALVFAAGVRQMFKGGWQGYARPLVAHYVDLLAAEIGTPPSVERAQALVVRLPLTVRIEGPVVQWQSAPGYGAAHEAWRSRHADEEAWGGPGEGTLRRTTTDGHRISFGLAAPPPALTQRAAGALTLLALLALTAAALWRVRRMLRPLDDIRAGAQRYGAGDFSQPIPQRRDDELGDLAGRVNAMASSLHGMLDAKRALLLAISHELRSPLTRARVNAELLAEGPERDALLRDLALMRDLVTDLLESERLAAGHAALHAQPTDLAALVREVAAPFVAQGRLELALDASVGERVVDPVRLRLLLRNLIDNALRHGGGGAPASVFLRLEGAAVALGVRDHGPGVPAAQLAALGEAFYRPDTARQRATGGVGLGLHLCRQVALAHGGSLVLSNAQPGLEVKALLPSAEPAAPA